MLNLIYRSPDGTELKNISEDFFKDIFLIKGDEYWNHQSYDAGIRILDNDFKAEIVIAFNNKYGFFIQHFYENEEDEYVISHSNDLSNKTTIYPGGEAWELPISFFSNRDDTLKTILEIVNSGVRPNNLKWVKLWDGDWDI